MKPDSTGRDDTGSKYEAAEVAATSAAGAAAAEFTARTSGAKVLERVLRRDELGEVNLGKLFEWLEGQQIGRYREIHEMEMVQQRKGVTDAVAAVVTITRPPGMVTDGAVSAVIGKR